MPLPDAPSAASGKQEWLVEVSGGYEVPRASLSSLGKHAET